MELDFIKKTEKIQILLFDVIGDFLQKFANRVFITIADSEENFNDFEIILLNTSNNKKINFYYSEGCNITNEKIIIYQFSIETDKTGAIKRNKFYLQDYALFKGLSYNQNIPPKEWEHYDNKLKELFTLVKLILEDIELNRVLFNDEWVEIPINLEPYK